MKTLFLVILNSQLLILNCFAQWQPDVRLTNDPGVSYTSYNNAWCIASSGNVVHVVWSDGRDGNREIYYKRSIDGGISWGVDTRLTNDIFNSWYPSVTVSVSVVHVVWAESRNGSYEIYYKRSTDAGVSWGADTRLTNNSALSEYPSVSLSGSVVHVVWYDQRDGNREIYYKRSTDAGSSWGTDTRLTNDPAASYIPSVSASGSAVHVVWHDNREVNYELYYKRSTDGGLSWGTDTRLTNDPANSLDPSVSVSGSVVHIVWRDNRDGNQEIYYKRSTDGGLSWGTDIRLTNNAALSERPSVSVSGSNVHVVWTDNRDGNEEIYYKRSIDGGISWETDTQLTNAPQWAQYPSISISGSVVHVVFTDYRVGNYEIYYKRDPTGNIVGIKKNNSEIPKSFSLSQNYPNPFNPATTIRFAIPSNLKAGAKLVIFDILGREVTTLVNEQLKPGTYEVEWDASRFSSGLYFYVLQSEKYSETRKMILIK